MDLQRDLATYYEREAVARARPSWTGRRDELRDSFIDRLCSESAHTVLDVGAGPARDGRPFVDAGLDYLGLDLAHANARLAAERQLEMVQGSLFDLPIRPFSIDAVWTMSTLLHVPDQRFHEAMQSIVSCMRPAGLLAIGLWGGFDRETVKEEDHFDPPRFFSNRSNDRIQSMLGEHGQVDSFESWSAQPGPGEYQFIVVRV